MTSPSDKHIYAAKAALTGSVIAFGAMRGYDDLVNSIAAALANAEREGIREGMKRAAEIARRHHVAHTPNYHDIYSVDVADKIISESERA